MTARIPHAVVALSGGQDSTTVLALARQRHIITHTVAFNYGQRHAVELEQARAISTKMKAGGTHWVLHVPSLQQLGDSALVTKRQDIGAKHAREDGLPASFVPGRNAVFLTLAHALAQQTGAKCVYAGVCQTDYSGYPDCRDDFVQSLEAALNIGYEKRIRLFAPLMHMNKAQTFAIAEKCGALDEVLELSHTCYEGDRENRHPWGYGCGLCPACKLRERGWDEFQSMNDREKAEAYDVALGWCEGGTFA